MPKLVQQSDFHRIATAGQARGIGVMRQSGRVERTADTASRVRRWRFSDGSVDRLGDRISPSGWQFQNFLRAGGPVLFAHDALAPPIGGTRSLSSDAVALTGDVEFADADTYEFADTVLRLIDAGFLKGGSVGFLPLQWQWTDDPARKGGIDFIQQELLEFSIAAVPALPTALVEARAIGIDTRPLSNWASRALDRGNSVVSRAELVRLHELAKEPPRSRSADLQRAMQIRARHAHARRDNSQAAELARAAEIRERLGMPDVLAMHEQAEELARRDRLAAVDQVMRAAVSW